MEFNKETRVNPSSLFDIQLKAITNRIKQLEQAGELTTIENAIAEASSLISNFSTNLGKPIGDKLKVHHGSLPDVDIHNTNIRDILLNLNILFESSDDLENTIIQSFNYIVAEADRVAKEIRKVSSSLLDYGIYTDNVSTGITYHTDSFNDSSKTERDISFINVSMASINDNVGSLTLAVKSDAESARRVSNIVLNDASNGLPGNNRQIGAQYNGDIAAILDSNPDTWFEYEVVANEDNARTEPLTLDMMLELEDIAVINSITIDPNNFGTKNPIIIDAIETSIDGSAWTTIEQQSSALEFLNESEESQFELSPSSSRYKGKGIFTFFPRNTRYIHVIFRQYDYYPIATSSGTKIRYAIGVKDIEIHGHQYEKESEIVSTKYYAPSEIKKVSIQSSDMSSKEVDLATVSHYISPDDGITWNTIQPRNVQATDYPEVLNFNTIDEGAIITGAPVSFIRHKINLKRNSDKFSSTSSILSETKKEFAETFNMSDKAPLHMDLTELPLPHTIIVLDPMFGSVGNNTRKKIVGISSGEGGQTFTLSWTGFDLNSENIWVGRSLWSRVPTLSGAAATDSVYSVDYESGTLIFGEGTNGAVPTEGSRIEVNFDIERILLDNNRIASLNFNTDADKSNFMLYAVDPDQNIYGEKLKKGATIHRLKNKNIVAASVYIDPDIVEFQTLKTYIDGQEELISPGDYSVDYMNGVLYSYSPAHSVDDTFVSYVYVPKTLLTKDQWDFYSTVDEYGLKNNIQISVDAYKTTTIKDEAISSGVKHAQLANTHIEPKSIKVKDPSVTKKLTEEVAFINGIDELDALIQVNEEPVPTGVDTFQLQASHSLETSVASSPRPEFSDKTVFDPAQELPWGTPPTTLGEYSIDYTTGNVKLPTGTSAEANTTVTYSYDDPTAIAGMTGRYSVDYKNGILYSYESIGAGTTVDYEFSNYEAIYNIARVVEDTKYRYDADINSIVVNDNEVIDSISQTRDTNYKVILKAVYEYIDREEGSLAELEPYYTPYVNGYAISMIDKDNMV